MTTVFRAVTASTMGAGTLAAGATAALAAGALSELLLVVDASVVNLSDALEVVSAAENCGAAVAKVTEFVGVNDVTVEDTVLSDDGVTAVEYAESDSGFDVDWVSADVLVCPRPAAASVDFGSDALLLEFVDPRLLVEVGLNVPDSVEPVWDPPLLLTVTPEPTWLLDDVEPDVVEVPLAVVPAPVDEEAELVDDSPPAVAADDGLVPVVPVVAAVEVPPVEPVEPEEPKPDEAEPEEDDPEEVPVPSALATPGDVMTRAPMPKAAANAPTRPMYPPSLPALWTVFRECGSWGALDEDEANSGLAGM